MLNAKFSRVLALMAFLLAPGIAATAADSVKISRHELGNAACLSCHEEQKGKLEVKGSEGDSRALVPVDAKAYAKSVHSGMECIACHLEIKDSAAPHQKTLGEKRPDCVACHLKLRDGLDKVKTAGERRSIRVVAENIETYRTSLHARPNADDRTRPNASCNDCHNVHSFNVPPRGTAARTDWHLGISDRCGSCHEDQLKTWASSVHGRAIKQKHDPKSADCVDCHTSHNVKSSASDKAKLAITANCGGCHTDAYASYRGTYHGQITTLGYAHTAKCFDCHSSHDIEPAGSSKSKMHLDNRLEACQECHSGKKAIPRASAGFVSFSPHGKSDDFAAYPQIWIANKAMVGLLVGTFGFFWLHTLLWFYREFRERKERLAQPHVKIDVAARTGEAPSRHFQRFSRTWRIAHLVFALSLMTLTLTGIPLFYPEAPWARPLIVLLTGPQLAGTVHRVSAVVFAGVFFWHLIYVGIRLARDWKNFKIFGPNSLVPGWQDMKDIVAMFKWFFGVGARPVFDRWTYWEKFDYWAPFWGVTIIGVSGIMMWIPHVTAQYLPGWVFNVAAIFHSEEAFLAVVFLFTVHFFNNHFRPDKFPLDRVMFVGTVTLEELKHDHPLQYQRLLESGELEQHLVPAPSARMTRLSTWLGFALIAVGLSLLTLVAIGFFTSLA